MTRRLEVTNLIILHSRIRLKTCEVGPCSAWCTGCSADFLLLLKAFLIYLSGLEILPAFIFLLSPPPMVALSLMDLRS